MSFLKNPPHRKPLQDTDLLRFVDAVIFGDNIKNLTPLEVADARKSDAYRMMQRVGMAMYRAGEQGMRPRPQLMVVEKAAAKEEQQTAAEVAEPA